MPLTCHTLTHLYDSEDPYDRVMGNIHFVNALMERHFTVEEIPDEALQSYYVDYYLSQVNNGGLSQFVYNSRWSPVTIERVRRGLASMGATAHLALFEELARMVSAVKPDDLSAYFESGYFGDGVPVRDHLETLSSRFFTLDKREDLIALNHAYLGRLSAQVIDHAEWESTMDALGATLPDREARRQAAETAAEAARSAEERGIRSICGDLGGEFDCLTAMSPAVWQGRPTLEWHFLLTDGRHYFAVFAGGQMAIVDDNKQVVVTSPFDTSAADEATATEEPVDDEESGDEEDPGSLYEGIQLFERAPNAVRPGPYCNETSTELTAPISKEQMLDWVKSHLGSLEPHTTYPWDFVAPTECGWTMVHLMPMGGPMYLGLEDTPGKWPSSRAVAQALADHFRVEVTLMSGGNEEVVTPARR